MADLVELAAQALRIATDRRVPTDPVSILLGTTSDIDVAYAVQHLNTRIAQEAGRRIVGRKIGLTSPAVQAQLGVDQPDFGVLFSDMEYSDGATIPAASVLQPRIEGEVAMVLRRDLDAGFHSLGELIRAVDFALPAIEVVDSRIRDWDITLVDTVADNASSGCYVLGTRPVRLDQLDLCSLPMQLTLNDRVESTGNGAMCLGNPLNALRWLADMACALGSPLLTGQVVLTGALGPMVAATPGSRVSVDFGPLGQVRCTVGADG